MSKFAFFTTLIVMVIFSLLPKAAFADDRLVEVLHVDYRKAEEALPIVRSLLSTEGSAGVDARTNSVVIVDSPQVIEKVREFLEDFDQPIKQVTIRVRISEDRFEQGGSASAEGTIGGDDVEVSTGKGHHDDKLSVRLEGERTTLAGISEYYVSASSGSPAYIVTGTSVPYRERLLILSRRHAHVSEGIEFRDVETGFEVTPTIAGDRAHLDITPRISYLASDNGRGVVRFTESSTSVTVPLNQWFSLSGSGQKSNEVFQEILGAGSNRQDSRLSISLLVKDQN
nr:hypothetical protein [Deltaproteobacteria bacterium]